MSDPRRVISAESILADIAAEVARMEVPAEPEKSAESFGIPFPVPDRNEEKKRTESLFASLLGGDRTELREDVEELRQAVQSLYAELSRAKQEREEERLRARQEQNALRAELAALRGELSELRALSEKCETRIFDNRIRIGALKEQLESEDKA